MIFDLVLLILSVRLRKLENYFIIFNNQIERQSPISQDVCYTVITKYVFFFISPLSKIALILYWKNRQIINFEVFQSLLVNIVKIYPLCSWMYNKNWWLQPHKILSFQGKNYPASILKTGTDISIDYNGFKSSTIV